MLTTNVLALVSLGTAIHALPPAQLTATLPNPVAVKGIIGNKLSLNSRGSVVVGAVESDLIARGSVTIGVSASSNSIQWLSNTSAVLSPSQPDVAFEFETTILGSVLFDFNTVNATSGLSSPDYVEPVPIDLTIVRSYDVEKLSQAFGWIYFTAWGVSFLPQIWENFRNKSVVGLNFDFVVLNLIAFACYTAYYILFYFDPAVQESYHSNIDPGSLPIAINDLCFAIWAFSLCAITAFQVLIYERGNQRISWITKGLVSGITIFIIVFSILAGVQQINMLTYAYGLSYVKVGITFVKMIPQIIQNYRRKMTTGMSIYQWWLDFAGGFFSLAQQITDGCNTNDWIGLFGNAPKTLLAFEALIFDVIMFVQHYILYRENNKQQNTYQRAYHVKRGESQSLLGLGGDNV